jgi:hypothetical protein
MNVMQIKKGVTHLIRRVTFYEGGGYHHYDEEKRGKGLSHPLWAAVPFSYIYVGHVPLHQLYT